MKLVSLASTYGEFFAPAFEIRIGGADLVRDLRVAVSQVEVDLKLGGTSHFSFTVTDSYDFPKHAFQTGDGKDAIKLLNFGRELEILLGYGNGKMVPMVSGMITEVTTNFPETGSPELSIGGHDHGFLMTLGTNSRTWSKAKDSTAVKEIAVFNNIDAVITTTKGDHDQIEQNQESDWAFLGKLADRNHYELYVDEKRRLHFSEPNDKAGAVVDLVWGEGLLSFKPEANLAGQIARVEVYGWDRNGKDTFVGVANAGEESGLTGKSAGQRIISFVRDASKQPTLRLRQPVFTQAEADRRAKAALNEHAKEFLTGDAESIGLPELRPDRKVSLSNLGEPFSKNYYIQQATHKVDSSGYRTRFKVKETGL